MANKNTSMTSIADRGLNIGALFLAATSASFAGYVIFIAPPTRTNNDQPSASQVLASTNQELSDPIITGATEKIQVGYKNLLPATTHAKYYRIRALTREGAVVDFKDNKISYSMVLKLGDNVPGFGQILSIENRNGNQYLKTTKGIFGQEGFISQK